MLGRLTIKLIYMYVNFAKGKLLSVSCLSPFTFVESSVPPNSRAFKLNSVTALSFSEAMSILVTTKGHLRDSDGVHAKSKFS